MNRKNRESKNQNGFVYSTDPNFNLSSDDGSPVETLSPAEQKLRLRLETKHRGGKTATIIYGFQGKDEDLEALGKQLKNHCGTGGSVKDGEVIVQGDHREKIRLFLLKNGYKQTKG